MPMPMDNEVSRFSIYYLSQQMSMPCPFFHCLHHPSQGPLFTTTWIFLGVAGNLLYRGFVNRPYKRVATNSRFIGDKSIFRNHEIPDKKIAKNFFNTGRPPPASHPPAPSKLQVTAFFAWTRSPPHTYLPLPLHLTFTYVHIAFWFPHIILNRA